MKNQKRFSMIEIIITLTLVAFAVGPIVLMLSTGVKNQEIVDEKSEMDFLAKDMLEEITAKEFEDPEIFGSVAPHKGDEEMAPNPTQESENNFIRNTFDDVDDYHNYETPFIDGELQGPLNMNGTPMDAGKFSKYKRSVKILDADGESELPEGKFSLKQTYACGITPIDMAMDKYGKRVYVLCNNGVKAYFLGINESEGMVEASCEVSVTAQQLKVAPTNDRVYILHSDNKIEIFRVPENVFNKSTGEFYRKVGEISGFLTGEKLRDIDCYGGTLYAVTEEGLFGSEDSGKNFSLIDAQTNMFFIRSGIFNHGEYVFAAYYTDTDPALYSIRAYDMATLTVVMDSVLPGAVTVDDIAIDWVNQNLWVSAGNVIVKKNVLKNGWSGAWETVYNAPAAADPKPGRMYFDRSTGIVYAHIGDEIRRTASGGNTWERAGDMGGAAIHRFLINGYTIMTATSTKGIRMSVDYGRSYTSNAVAGMMRIDDLYQNTFNSNLIAAQAGKIMRISPAGFAALNTLDFNADYTDRIVYDHVSGCYYVLNRAGTRCWISVVSEEEWVDRGVKNCVRNINLVPAITGFTLSPMNDRGFLCHDREYLTVFDMFTFEKKNEFWNIAPAGYKIKEAHVTQSGGSVYCLARDEAGLSKILGSSGPASVFMNVDSGNNSRHVAVDPLNKYAFVPDDDSVSRIVIADRWHESFSEEKPLFSTQPLITAYPPLITAAVYSLENDNGKMNLSFSSPDTRGQIFIYKEFSFAEPAKASVEVSISSVAGGVLDYYVISLAAAEIEWNNFNALEKTMTRMAVAPGIYRNNVHSEEKYFTVVFVYNRNSSASGGFSADYVNIDFNKPDTAIGTTAQLDDSAHPFSNPTHVRFSGDGTRVYVMGNDAAGKKGFFVGNTVFNKITFEMVETKSPPLLGNPDNIVVPHFGRSLYITDLSDNNVEVLELLPIIKVIKVFVENTETGIVHEVNTSVSITKKQNEIISPLVKEEIVDMSFLHPAGKIESDEIWAGGKVYYLPQTLSLKNNARLVVQPGALVKTLRGQDIIVDTGSFYSFGTFMEPVIFTTHDDNSRGGILTFSRGEINPDNYWNGLSVFPAQSAIVYRTEFYGMKNGVQVNNASSDFRYLTAAESEKGVSYANCANFHLEHFSGYDMRCTIPPPGNEGTGVIVSNSDGVLELSRIRDCRNTGLYIGSSGLAGALEIRQNDFRGNQSADISVSGSAPVITDNMCSGMVTFSSSDADFSFNAAGSFVADGSSLNVFQNYFMTGPATIIDCPGNFHLNKLPGNNFNATGTLKIENNVWNDGIISADDHSPAFCGIIDDNSFSIFNYGEVSGGSREVVILDYVMVYPAGTLSVPSYDSTNSVKEVKHIKFLSRTGSTFPVSPVPVIVSGLFEVNGADRYELCSFESQQSDKWRGFEVFPGQVMSFQYGSIDNAVTGMRYEEPIFSMYFMYSSVTDCDTGVFVSADCSDISTWDMHYNKFKDNTMHMDSVQIIYPCHNWWGSNSESVFNPVGQNKIGVQIKYKPWAYSGPVSGNELWSRSNASDRRIKTGYAYDAAYDAAQRKFPAAIIDDITGSGAIRIEKDIVLKVVHKDIQFGCPITCISTSANPAMVEGETVFTSIHDDMDVTDNENTGDASDLLEQFPESSHMVSYGDFNLTLPVINAFAAQNNVLIRNGTLNFDSVADWKSVCVTLDHVTVTGNSPTPKNIGGPVIGAAGFVMRDGCRFFPTSGAVIYKGSYMRTFSDTGENIVQADGSSDSVFSPDVMFTFDTGSAAQQARGDLDMLKILYAKTGILQRAWSAVTVKNSYIECSEYGISALNAATISDSVWYKITQENGVGVQTDQFTVFNFQKNFFDMQNPAVYTGILVKNSAAAGNIINGNRFLGKVIPFVKDANTEVIAAGNGIWIQGHSNLNIKQNDNAHPAFNGDPGGFYKCSAGIRQESSLPSANISIAAPDIHENYFDLCDAGVFVLNTALDIQNNTFHVCYPGVFAISSPYMNRLIKQNTFSHSYINMKQSNLDVYENTFSNQAGAVVKSLEAISCGLDFYKNRITSPADGIVITDTNGDVHENIFTLNKSSITLKQQSASYSASNLNIYKNVFSKSTLYGINSANGMIPKIACNVFDGTSTGIHCAELGVNRGGRAVARIYHNLFANTQALFASDGSIDTGWLLRNNSFHNSSVAAGSEYNAHHNYFNSSPSYTTMSGDFKLTFHAPLGPMYAPQEFGIVSQLSSGNLSQDLTLRVKFTPGIQENAISSTVKNYLSSAGLSTYDEDTTRSSITVHLKSKITGKEVELELNETTVNSGVYQGTVTLAWFNVTPSVSTEKPKPVLPCHYDDIRNELDDIITVTLNQEGSQLPVDLNTPAAPIAPLMSMNQFLIYGHETGLWIKWQDKNPGRTDLGTAKNPNTPVEFSIGIQETSSQTPGNTWYAVESDIGNTTLEQGLSFGYYQYLLDKNLPKPHYYDRVGPINTTLYSSPLQVNPDNFWYAYFYKFSGNGREYGKVPVTPQGINRYIHVIVRARNAGGYADTPFRTKVIPLPNASNFSITPKQQLYSAPSGKQNSLYEYTSGNKLVFGSHDLSGASIYGVCPDWNNFQWSMRYYDYYGHSHYYTGSNPPTSIEFSTGSGQADAIGSNPPSGTPEVTIAINMSTDQWETRPRLYPEVYGFNQQVIWAYVDAYDDFVGFNNIGYRATVYWKQFQHASGIDCSMDGVNGGPYTGSVSGTATKWSCENDSYELNGDTSDYNIPFDITVYPERHDRSPLTGSTSRAFRWNRYTDKWGWPHWECIYHLPAWTQL